MQIFQAEESRDPRRPKKKMRHRIVITGATGFLGRQLVPRLLEGGFNILLVGRSASKIHRVFGKVKSCEYEDLARELRAGDSFVHLAAMNNSSQGPECKFNEVNAGLLKECALSAKVARVKKFIHISSVHAVDERNVSPYARSKRLGKEGLQAISGLPCVSLYLPMVYGDSWSGRLKFLNYLPQTIVRRLFPMVAALKPTLHVDTLVAEIVRLIDEPTLADRIVADDKDRNLIYKTFKRSGDIAFAITALSCFWWLYLLLWVLIRIESKGPAIFVQSRVGQNGELFSCYKFRTMRLGTEQVGTHQISSKMVTRVGRLIRKIKLDELPQVINLLRNEITLVGPRPCLPMQENLVSLRERHGVLAIKPGITGWAQIHGVDMSDPGALVQRDAEYIGLRSIAQDFSIMICTALGRGQGDRVRPAAPSVKKAA